MKVHVFKIGGGIMDESSSMEAFLEKFQQQKGNKILVHGGGKGANKVLEKLGITQNMIDGRRITDRETLDVVVALYAGLYNKQVVAQLQKLGENALGLSGADGKLMLSKKREVLGVDYGFVGDPIAEHVNTSLLTHLMKNLYTPVCCAITMTIDGQLLNTNADTVASTLAISLAESGCEVSLTFCFDKIGVLENVEDEKTLIKTINKAAYIELLEKKIITDGMRPKLDNAFSVLSKGVKEIVICHPAYLGSGIGTQIIN